MIKGDREKSQKLTGKRGFVRELQMSEFLHCRVTQTSGLVYFSGIFTPKECGDM
jgi:hypothetical protein